MDNSKYVQRNAHRNIVRNRSLGTVHRQFNSLSAMKPETSERNKEIIQAMLLRAEMIHKKKEIQKGVPTLTELCVKYNISQTRLYQIFRKYRESRSVAG